MHQKPIDAWNEIALLHSSLTSAVAECERHVERMRRLMSEMRTCRAELRETLARSRRLRTVHTRPQALTSGRG
jgi:hypothetical protein